MKWREVGEERRAMVVVMQNEPKFLNKKKKKAWLL